MEDRPLTSFVAEPDDSIVANTRFAPASPTLPSPAAGREGWGESPEVCGTSGRECLIRPLVQPPAPAAQEYVWP